MFFSFAKNNLLDNWKAGGSGCEPGLIKHSHNLQWIQARRVTDKLVNVRPKMFDSHRCTEVPRAPEHLHRRSIDRTVDGRTYAVTRRRSSTALYLYCEAWRFFRSSSKQKQVTVFGASGCLRTEKKHCVRLCTAATAACTAPTFPEFT